MTCRGGHTEAKKALHWTKGGKDFFSRGHMIPAIRMPKRPYMKPSAEEHREEIIAAFRDAIAGVLEK